MDGCELPASDKASLCQLCRALKFALLLHKTESVRHQAQTPRRAPEKRQTRLLPVGSQTYYQPRFSPRVGNPGRPLADQTVDPRPRSPQARLLFSAFGTNTGFFFEVRDAALKDAHISCMAWC